MSCHTINYDIVNYGIKNRVSKHACRELLFFSQTELKYTSSYFSTCVAVCGKPYYYQHVAKYMICVWTAGRHRCCVVVERFSFIIYVVVERFGRSDNQIPERGSISSIDRKIRFEKNLLNSWSAQPSATS